jgi:hypothetical protein
MSMNKKDLLNDQNCLKDTFYDNTKGIECGIHKLMSYVNEHAKNCRMG